MEDRTFILKENSVPIRNRISGAGIHVCHCASFEDSVWLDYSTYVDNGVHGVGYPYEGMTKEETLSLFLHEVQNPVFCNDVGEFIRLIKEFENGKVK